MSTHTPGPWMMIEHDEGPRTVLVDIVQADDPYGVVVAADLDVLRQADARLMTAAPELLAALRNLVPRFRSCIIAHGSGAEYADEAVKSAVAAIAKAEGGA